MSDLQCPTRVFLARHGEADYETDLVTDDGGSLSPAGRRQARELGERLRGERIARVWCSPLSRAVQTAEIAAAVLGVDVVVREGLREYGVGALAGTTADEGAELGPVFGAWVAGDDAARIPGGEGVAAIAARVAGVLDEVRGRAPRRGRPGRQPRRRDHDDGAGAARGAAGDGVRPGPPRRRARRARGGRLRLARGLTVR